jgi:AbrB family looped-hinge helix DNA binding protein
MPAKKKVDGTQLIKMVENGKHQSEIMKAFDLNTTAQLKAHYLDALMNAGKAAALTSGRGKANTNTAKEAQVSKRGSVVIPKAIIEEMGFKEGDKFILRRTKSGISMRHVEE